MEVDSLEGRLVVVFEHFNEIYRSISARLKAEQLRVRKMDVWDSSECLFTFTVHSATSALFSVHGRIGWYFHSITLTI